MASKGSADPSKSAPKGSAGPLKIATSKDDSSSSRCLPPKVRVDRVLVDVEGFSHPRRSTPSTRPQVPPKPVASDRLKKAEQILVLQNQFSALPDDEWTRYPSRLTEAMEHSIIQWNVRGFQANFEELALLSRRYKPPVLQETFLTSSKTPSFSGFNILTKNSINDRATGGVALLINKSYLFSEVHLNTPLQTVAARVTLNKVVTFCSIYLPPSDHVAKTNLINLIEQLPSPFFWAISTVTPRSGVSSPITAEEKCWRISSQKWIYIF